MNRESSHRYHFLFFIRFYNQDSALPVGIGSTALILLVSSALRASMQMPQIFLIASNHRKLPSRETKETVFLPSY